MFLGKLKKKGQIVPKSLVLAKYGGRGAAGLTKGSTVPTPYNHMPPAEGACARCHAASLSSMSAQRLCGKGSRLGESAKWLACNKRRSHGNTRAKTGVDAGKTKLKLINEHNVNSSMLRQHYSRGTHVHGHL